MINPRHKWLRERCGECLKELEDIQHVYGEDFYIKKLGEVAEELLYAATEWQKYYKEGN